MNDYKQWSATERQKSLALTNKAIANGEIPSPTKCNRCTATHKKMHYHNHDYSDHIKYLEAVCITCHRMLHRRFKDPLTVCEYFEQLWLMKHKYD